MKNSLMLISLISAVLVLGLCAIPGGSEATLAGDAQTIDRAADFFDSLGWSDTETDFVVDVPEGSRSYAKEVKIGKLLAHVDESTGQIHGAINKDVLARAVKDIVNITEDQANQQAVGCLQAAGVPTSDMRFLSSKAVHYSTSPGLTMWEVRFQRVHNGYPFYPDDFALVTLDPEDGTVSAFGYNFRSPLPESTNVKIDKGAALGNATAYLESFGLQAGPVVSIDLQIVQPNDYWEYLGTGTLPPAPTFSRLAWVITFNGPWQKTEVWIDSETGDILGGVKSTSIPTKMVRFPYLGASETIGFSFAGKRSAGTATIPAGSAGGKRLIDAFSELRETSAGDTLFDLTVNFQGRDRSYTFGYSEADHLFVLLSKKHGDQQMNIRIAWKTTDQFEAALEEAAGFESASLP